MMNFDMMDEAKTPLVKFNQANIIETLDETSPEKSQEMSDDSNRSSNSDS